MSSTCQSSYFLEDKSKPLNPNTASLNDALQTEYLDIADEDDSVLANMTRFISKIVGAVLTPRQVLRLLRVLKAVTLSFLVLTILSDLMYIIFVELLATDEVLVMAGGVRDVIIRVYGFILSLLGLAVELDYSKIVKKFSGLKGFIPRALLYFFIMQLTGTDPTMLNLKDGDGAVDDDVYGNAQMQIPSSAVGFQRVTSFVLGICALGYLVCGVLCFDRFTARAFLSNRDPRITTAIPRSTGESGGMNITANDPGHASTVSEGSTARESTVGNSTVDRTGDPPGW